MGQYEFGFIASAKDAWVHLRWLHPAITEIRLACADPELWSLFRRSRRCPISRQQQQKKPIDKRPGPDEIAPTDCSCSDSPGQRDARSKLIGLDLASECRKTVGSI